MRSAVILALAMVVPGCTVDATEDTPAAQTVDQNQMAGTILETLDASSYTYVRFETPDGEAWAAVPQAHLEIGARVVIANPQTMVNFESKALGRNSTRSTSAPSRIRAFPPRWPGAGPIHTGKAGRGRSPRK